MGDPSKKLAEAIAGGEAVLVVGAGVSRAVSGRDEALWGGLLQHGVAYCEKVCEGLAPGWGDRQRSALEDGDADEMIGVAELVGRKLGAPADVRFRNWLEETVGSLPRNDGSLLDALSGLRLPFATTNYDSLLEDATGLPPVTWRRPETVLAALRGEEEGILHLHGHWRDPESVVLGVRSYEQILGHTATQALQHGLALFRHLVFIGCGAGLADPNFAALRRWLRATFPGQRHRHFRLCLDGEVEDLQKEHAADRIVPFPFGPRHDDLAPFLSTLAREIKGHTQKTDGGAQPSSQATPEIPSTSDGVLRRYLDRLRAAHQHLPLPGFGNQVRIPIRLEEVYVPLRGQVYYAATEADYKEAGAQRELMRERAEAERDVPLDEALTLAGEHAFQGLVVLGDPGSGKTTLLRHFIAALTHPNQGPSALGLPEGTLPVFIELRRLGRPTAGLRSAITEAVSLADISLRAGEAPAFAEELLGRGHLLVLVDGLDEVADPAERAAISRWLEQALVDLPQSRFVLTCRYAGYKGDSRLSGRFLELRVRDLTPEEAQRFISAWYDAVEAQAVLDRDPEVARRIAAEATQELADRLFTDDPRTKSLRELATNPLLLQILCLVHRDRKHLPERRVELYRHCTEVLLESWRQLKKLPVDLTAERALKLLQPLAWWLHRQGEREAPAEDLLPHLAAPLKLFGRSPETGEAVLDAIRDQSGLLVSLGQGQYGFLHQSFQEYLAARHLQDQALRQPELLHEAAGHYGEEWWREVLLLAVGLSTPSLFEPLLFELTRTGKLATDVSLADDLLRDAAEPTPAPLLEALATDLEAAEDRYHALRLLRQLLPTWDEAELESGASPRALVEKLAREDPSESVRRLASELLGLEQAAETKRAKRRAVFGEPLAMAPEVAPRPPANPLPGDEWVHEPSGMVLVYVPGGEYPQGADDITGDEKPVHSVKLSPYWIGKYPVTNAEYARFVGANPDQPKPEYWEDKRFNGAQQPVVGVSWSEAKAYCAWAGLDLPSEAQWEAAARGEDGRKYPWGDDEPTSEHANFGDREGRTTPVGSYPRGAGPFGTLDQTGNVWEWCEDAWDSEAYSERGGVVDPVNRSGEAANRVVRGGAWNDSGRNLRAAYRNGRHASVRYQLQGFRCVCRAGLEPGG